MSTFGMQQDTNTNWCWFPVSSYSCSIPSLSCTFHLISGSVSRMWFLREAKYDFPGLIHPHVGSCSHTMDTDKCMNQCVSVSGMSVTWIIICELEWCLVKQWAVRHRDKLCTLLSVPSGTTGRVSTILCVCVCGACTCYKFLYTYKHWFAFPCSPICTDDLFHCYLLLMHTLSESV